MSVMDPDPEHMGGGGGGGGGGFKPSRFLGICLTPISCNDTLAN